MHENWTLYDARTEEGIRQRDRIDFCHCRIIDKVWIDEEKNRHIDSLSGIEPLLFETEALNLAKIWRHLCWSNTVGSDPNDIFSTFICCRIKRERGLSGQDSDLSLLWRKLPGHYIRY